MLIEFRTFEEGKQGTIWIDHESIAIVEKDRNYPHRMCIIHTKDGKERRVDHDDRSAVFKIKERTGQ